jgi:hypothetical protein
MKPSKYFALFSLLNALAFCLTRSPAHAGQANHGSQPDGQVKSHIGNKGSANTYAQWSADPERGWVRVNERHQRHEESQASGKFKHNRGKQKGNRTRDKTNN